VNEGELRRLQVLLDRVHVGMSDLCRHVESSEFALDIVKQIGTDLGAACAMVNHLLPPKDGLN